MKSEFWNQKYNTKQFVYGNKPNVFFANHLQKITPGTLLLPAEGEGRNAIYAAGLGFDVTAFDQSSVAREKAMAWAKDEKLQINYLLADIYSFSFTKESFDIIGLIYAHLQPSDRKYLHKKAAQALKPGGKLVLEAFSKEQFNYNSGGPRNEDMLYSVYELKEDFGSLHINSIGKEIISLQEGTSHDGKASVIRMVAEKMKN